jgi:mannose/cellobiose epimerase-like protein (N-acyl-D-glucosamine 2-epimerase family)
MTTAAASANLHREAAELVRRYTAGTLPLWLENGWDAARGGVVERLDADGRPMDIDHRRLLVHGRQLYQFSCWGRQRGETAWLIRAGDILDYMLHRFRDNSHGGWFTRVDAAGRVIDPAKDLYAFAFVIFGLAHHFGATGESSSRRFAEETVALVRDKFARPDGLLHDSLQRDFTDPAPVMRQNPHMHLLEALLALHEVTGDGDTLAFATTIADRFAEVLVDERGHVIEFMTPTLAPDAETGHRVEPGHHFEWAWLLDRLTRALGDDRFLGLARWLHTNGASIGADQAHAGIYDVIDRRDDSILSSRKRIWPATEWLKAALARRRRGEADDKEALAAIRLLAGSYLHADGRWSEHLDRKLAVVDATMPASTPYHLGMAMAELQELDVAST